MKNPKVKYADLTGRRFYRWKCLSFAGRHKNGKVLWNCLCDCGSKVKVLGDSLICNRTKSCGCFLRELSAKRLTTHGLSQAGGVYKVWALMKERCLNPNNKSFHNYGGRGISVCDRWLHSFENFLADMGQRPTPKHSIDRKDNDGDYTPDNCRWATQREQNGNTRSNRRITLNGETMILADWSRKSGIAIGTLHRRLKAGWDFERAIFQKPKK